MFKKFLIIYLLVIIFGCVSELSQESDKGLEYVVLDKVVELSGFETYYYTDITCNSDEVIVSFRGFNNSLPPHVYAVVFDKDLNQQTGFIDLTSELPAHDYPDHVLIHHNGSFYGAFNGAWGWVNGDLHVLKFDSDLKLIGHEELINFTDGFDDVGTRFISLDSPMITVYNGTVYVMASTYTDREINGSKKGLMVWELSLDLSFKKQVNLTWEGDFDGAWLGDVIPVSNGYRVVTSGEKPIKLFLLEFNNEGVLTSKRQLIPNQTARERGAEWQLAHSRAVLHNDKYYVQFNGGPEELKKKDPSYYPELNNFVAVFDADFNFERLIKITDYSSVMHSQLYIEPEKYACLINDSIYSNIGFSQYNGVPRNSFSDYEMLYLLKYEIVDEFKPVQNISLPFPSN